MYYSVNGRVGKEGDFNGLIAECLKYEGKISITPLAESREKLFGEIAGITCDIDSLAVAIREKANLHQQEGTLIDYCPEDYVTLAHMIKELCDRISLLAQATDSEEPLKPLE